MTNDAAQYWDAEDNDLIDGEEDDYPTIPRIVSWDAMLTAALLASHKAALLGIWMAQGKRGRQITELLDQLGKEVGEMTRYAHARGD